jgi:hypothetical protein
MKTKSKQIHRQEPRKDRSAFPVFSSFEGKPSRDRAYWHSRTPENACAMQSLSESTMDPALPNDFQEF